LGILTVKKRGCSSSLFFLCPSIPGRVWTSPPKSPSPKREGDLICCILSPSLLEEGFGERSKQS